MTAFPIQTVTTGIGSAIIDTMRTDTGHKSQNKMADLNGVFGVLGRNVMNAATGHAIAGGWCVSTKAGPLPGCLPAGLSWNNEISVDADGRSKRADICHAPPGTPLQAVAERSGFGVLISAGMRGQTICLEPEVFQHPDYAPLQALRPGRYFHRGAVALDVEAKRDGGLRLRLGEARIGQDRVSLGEHGWLRLLPAPKVLLIESKMPLSSTGKNKNNATENLSGLVEKIGSAGHAAGAIVLLRLRTPVYGTEDGMRVLRAIETFTLDTLDAYHSALRGTPSMLLPFEDTVDGVLPEEALINLGPGQERSEFWDVFAADLRVRLLDPEETARRIAAADPLAAQRARDILDTYCPDAYARQLRLVAPTLMG